MKKNDPANTSVKAVQASEERASRASRILYFVISGAFILGLIYVPLRAALDESYRENTGYQLMIFQLIMGLVALNLPAILTRRYRWKIPNILMIIFFLFMLGAVVLGEVAEFYYRIPFWDDILHLTSSMMFGLIGFSMIEILNNDKKHALVNLSPFFVSVFAVSFAVLIGALWEIYEFTFDGLLGLNMQKFANESGEGGEILINLIGRDALVDTMHDLIIDFSGAVVASLIGYVSLKHNTGWLKLFKIEVFAPSADKESQNDATLCENNGKETEDVSASYEAEIEPCPEADQTDTDTDEADRDTAPSDYGDNDGE